MTDETSVERIATSDASPALRTVAQFSRQISAHQVKENKQRKERQQNVPSLEDLHQVKINKNNIRDPDSRLVLKEKKKVEEVVPGAGETSAHKDDDGRKKHRKLSDVGDETRTTKMNVRWIPETPNNTRILDLVEHIGQCQETECSQAGCSRLKKIVSHTKHCRRLHCEVCRPVTDVLRVHARLCQVRTEVGWAPCPVIILYYRWPCVRYRSVSVSTRGPEDFRGTPSRISTPNLPYLKKLTKSDNHFLK